MELQFFGGNCFLLEINKNKFAIDPLPGEYSTKNKFNTKNVSCVLSTGIYRVENESDEEAFQINTPGEYEINGAIVKGIQTSSLLDVHDAEKAGGSNVILTVHANDIGLCVLGNPALPLTESLLEEIGTVDILILPVGGGGLTVSPEQAAGVVKQIEPKICIPSHFSSTTISYPSPQDDLKKFFEAMGKGEVADDQKLKIKSSDLADDINVLALQQS